MKKLITTLSLLILLTGCNEPVLEYTENFVDDYAYGAVPQESRSGDVAYKNAPAAPDGWDEFCWNYSYAVPRKTRKTYNDMLEVFNSIYDNFNYVSDGEGKNSWDLLAKDNLNGDCEDFAITLKQWLNDAGFPKCNTRLATGWLPFKGDYVDYHCVLIVELYGGEKFVCSVGGITPHDSYDILWDLEHSGTEEYWMKKSRITHKTYSTPEVSYTQTTDISIFDLP